MIDRVTIPPTMTGPHGRFWEIDQQEITSRIKAAGNWQPDYEATLGAWIIEAPYAHPVWHSYFMTLVHLRTIPGVRPPNIGRLKEATHEIMLFALDPNKPREPAIKGHELPASMSPHNFVGQFIASTDGMALDRMRTTAEKIIDGRLNPDTDYIRWWAAEFGDHMLKPGWDRGDSLHLSNGETIIIPPAKLPS